MHPAITRTGPFQRRFLTEPRPVSSRRQRSRNANPARERTRVLLGGLILLSSGIAWSTQPDEPVRGQLQVAAGDDAIGQATQQVYELMELETARAVERARHSADAGSGLHTQYYAADTAGGLHTHDDLSKQAHAKHLPERPEGLKLVAIYGVGKKLAAQVVAGTQSFLYRHGQALPVGIPADSADTSMYTLRGISNSCVVLERDQKAQTLCLHPDFRVDSAGGRP